MKSREQRSLEAIERKKASVPSRKFSAPLPLKPPSLTSTTVILSKEEIVNRDEQHAKLESLLTGLKAGQYECIEFGNPQVRYYAGLRIRYMNTAGGMQFQLKEVRSGGREGSGYYTTSLVDLMAMAWKLVDHYMRPLPFSPLASKIEIARQNFEFYPVSERSTAPQYPNTAHKLDPDAVTITLSLGDKP